MLTQSLIPLTVPDVEPLPVVAYDPVRAEVDLDEDGWRRGADGVRAKAGRRLSIEIAIPAGSASAAILADVVRDGWARIGVDASVRSWAPAEFFGPYGTGGTLEAGKFDVALLAAGLGSVYADLGGSFDCASVPPAGSNFSRYCNRALDGLIRRYDSTSDAVIRRRESREMERILDADVPAIVLFERTFTSVYDARLRGYAPSAYSAWGDPLDLEFVDAP